MATKSRKTRGEWKVDIDESVSEDIQKDARKFLTAVGIEGVNIATMENCPVVTGLFRNSITYRIDDGRQSAFGNSPGNEPGNHVPDEADRVSKPTEKMTVRVGTAVDYANKVETLHGTMANAFDRIRVNLDRIAQRVFK